MAKLVRFGVAMEDTLLQKFDQYIRRKGYRNRSEAIRDLARDAIIQEAWEQEKGEVIAVVAIIYDHEKHGLSNQITDLQHHALSIIVSTLHVHLDERHCLEVVVLRGKSLSVRRLANRLLAIKGVLHGGIVATGVPLTEDFMDDIRSLAKSKLIDKSGT
ncbi:MAG: nickel-responsive transcriptional regulator NikR [Armatimonadetes bacterium]|nr:nickel-responsive transcriptional regulator NikR [Armatimonadota bacterium]